MVRKALRKPIKKCGEAAPKLRANESALKMPADGRKHEAFDLLLLGEWAFSLERLFSSFRRCVPKLVPQTDSKGVLWKAFATFRPFTKVSARPGMRGKLCASRIFRAGEIPLKSFHSLSNSLDFYR
ncbi:MAG: hypothetical protein E7569_15640 [Ruminococcaceae bacterium]|nr:hypothetical protein [Oscillospiraceae bacterium]